MRTFRWGLPLDTTGSVLRRNRIEESHADVEHKHVPLFVLMFASSVAFQIRAYADALLSCTFMSCFRTRIGVLYLFHLDRQRAIFTEILSFQYDLAQQV